MKELGIACREPSIVREITTAAETSTNEAGKLIETAQTLRLCVRGRFKATLEEQIGTGVDVDGYTYEIWVITSNGVTAYSFFLTPPSI